MPNECLKYHSDIGFLVDGSLRGDLGVASIRFKTSTCFPRKQHFSISKFEIKIEYVSFVLLSVKYKI